MLVRSIAPLALVLGAALAADASFSPGPINKLADGSVAAQAAVKLAFYNIRSGMGIPGLPGHQSPFSNVRNCTDRSKPVNAWGTGLVQQTLTSAIASDPSILALGLAEAWKDVCGSPERVRAVLGWKTASEVRNGVALVARYGLRDQRWQQLDTSRNKAPSDTVWIMRAAVCADPRCRHSLITYVSHWYGTGPAEQSTYATQARQTLDFMRATSDGRPHVLIGDLNVWTAPGVVCHQTPNGAEALQVLAAAKYVDAWRAIHGDQKGDTGMLNRGGCGEPEGAAWKRIDYAWSPAGYRPLDMSRFGVVQPGEAAPSDHYGIIATYPLALADD
ncbi:MAG TPA: endonuclease/exonuclease/phosphatase family protein [Vicinamibacterales bacterium]